MARNYFRFLFPLSLRFSFSLCFGNYSVDIHYLHIIHAGISLQSRMQFIASYQNMGIRSMCEYIYLRMTMCVRFYSIFCSFFIHMFSNEKKNLRIFTRFSCFPKILFIALLSYLLYNSQFSRYHLRPLQFQLKIWYFTILLMKRQIFLPKKVRKHRFSLENKLCPNIDALIQKSKRSKLVEYYSYR